MKISSSNIRFLFMLLPSIGYAQANIWFGTGLNFAKMRKVYKEEVFSEEDNTRLGLNLGLYLNQACGEKTAIETALIYDTKGYISHYEMEDARFTERFRIHYFNLSPIMLQHYFPLEEKQRYYIKTGPVLSIGLHGKIIQSDDNSYDVEVLNWEDKEIKRLDLAWNLSLGYEYNEALQVELGYDMGLKNISYDRNENLKLRNRCLKITTKISLSYLFAPVVKKGQFINQYNED